MKETFFAEEATRAVHGGEPPNAAGGLALTVDPSVAFRYSPEAGTSPAGGFMYARYAHPTGNACAQALAALEGSEACLLTNSGMAAISATVLALLSSGGHVIAPRSLYSATRQLFVEQLPLYGVSTTFLDEMTPEALEAARRPETRLVWLESPSNPLLKLTDFDAVSTWARQAGVLTAADNTFATPLGSRPLLSGIDIVIHSATKYLGGHGDLLAGAILSDQELITRITPWLTILGSGLSAQGAWTLRRGLSTLPLRVARHAASAHTIAKALESHPEITEVFYPYLPSHPDHDLARRQLRNGGGVVSFRVRGGRAAALSILRRVRLCAPALSLGEPRTLIAHPATMHFGRVDAEERARMGVTDDLMRVAVGLEEPQDILADLDAALAPVPNMTFAVSFEI